MRPTETTKDTDLWLSVFS